MNSVERVKMLCKQRKVPIARLERELKFSNGYISQLRKGTLPYERAVAIANYFDVDLEYLLTGVETKKESTSIPESELIEGSAKQKLIDLILNDDISEDQAQAWIALIESVKNNRLN